jgi:hypothetical protein
MSKHFSMISIKNAMGQTASDLAVASRRVRHSRLPFFSFDVM